MSYCVQNVPDSWRLKNALVIWLATHRLYVIVTVVPVMSVTVFMVQTIFIDFLLTIYHQGFFHSVRRNPSLNCFHRRRSLAILGHAGPKWRIRLSIHLILGLPCRLVHSYLVLL